MSVILVVDDDPVAQVTFKARLKKKGYLVLATGSATEALAYMTADSRPDLILLDVHMPFVNGFEFARNLKAGAISGESVPIVFVSADNSAETRAQARKLGGVGFLTKPWKPERLYAVVEDALARTSIRRAAAQVATCC